MPRESILAGQLRELGVVLFAFLSSAGIIAENTVGAWSAAFIAVSLLILAFMSPQKVDWKKKLTTLVRKSIGAVGGVLIAYSFFSSVQIDSFTALATAIFPLFWSLIEKKGKKSSGRVALLLFSCFLFLPSCQSANFNASIQSASGDAKAGIKSDGKFWSLWGAKDDLNTGQEYRASVSLPVIPSK